MHEGRRARAVLFLGKEKVPKRNFYLRNRVSLGIFKWEKRELVNAVLYFVDNGCKWRNLPHDFPPYTAVANFYYAAIRSGLWEKIRAALVERMRTDTGRNADPSYAIIDSQSVKTTSAAEERGIDGEKNKRTQTAHRSGYYG